MTSTSNQPSSISTTTSNLTQEERRLCQTQACKIQWCLQHRNHNEKFCQAYIDDWKKCIEKVRIAAAINDGSGNMRDETDNFSTRHDV
mmetsp:Transcript_2491/g.2706  ORF Transcript_2491/g.2706 Transcript_2491/m.2706 type:complete len:88 (+) Transcript_2491:31-294(+)